MEHRRSVSSLSANPSAIIRTCYKLLAAGWLFCCDEGEASESILDWTGKGRQRALLVRHVIRTYGLERCAEASFCFSVESSTSRLAGAGGNSDAAAREFWAACLEELGLGLEPASLAAFVRLMMPEEQMERDFSPPPKLAICLVTGNVCTYAGIDTGSARGR